MTAEQPGGEPDAGLVELVAQAMLAARNASLSKHSAWDSIGEGQSEYRLDARAAIAAMQPELAASSETSRQAGLMAFADTLQREVDTHIHENWMYDSDCGCWDTRNEASRSWVSDREELIERIRTLASPPATPEGA